MRVMCYRAQEKRNFSLTLWGDVNLNIHLVGELKKFL